MKNPLDARGVETDQVFLLNAQDRVEHSTTLYAFKLNAWMGLNGMRKKNICVSDAATLILRPLQTRATRILLWM